MSGKVLFKSVINFCTCRALYNTNKHSIYSNAIACAQSRSFSITTKMFKSAVFNLQEATKDQVQEFLNSFDTVLTDCDGMSFL